MMCQMPKTPANKMIKTRKTSKTSKRSIQDQIEEFMAFESHSSLYMVSETEDSPDLGDLQFEMLMAASLENRIETWLSNIGVCRDDPKSKKDQFFGEKKLKVAQIIFHNLPKDIDCKDTKSLDQDGNYTSSPLSMRRQIAFDLSASLNFSSSLPSTNEKISKSTFFNHDQAIDVMPRRKINSDSKAIYNFHF